MNRLLLTLCLAGLAGPVFAQLPASAPRADAQVHRFEIRDGVVYHDGVALPESAVPDDIELRGFPPMSLDYSGDVAPAFEIDGRLFAFDGERLVEVQDAMEAAPQTQAFALSQPKALGRSAAVDGAVRQRQAEQEYMDSLSETDRALYEQLVHERDMEVETAQLAQDYHRASSDAERASIRAELRAKLGAMFDLKQENRREEVRQMEEALEGLRKRMDERRAMRDKIVEYRLNELIGQ